ncbi:hypothetical protein [Actinomadura sp. 7K507]|uniref:hypothetical protein n=1 Tax=Actinomadura sp. 7K507 TaxID=2530365 RepID=UPI00105344C6|nr:hypothetical protein [Actinomadura sp. 7K507]TDC90229.1 hypothetical protein E1285_15165 [Actinomadura sp. 7K507]
MATRPTLADRFVIGSDIEKYSSRSVRRQVELQRTLHELLNTAAEEVGLDRGSWQREPGGDGELAILPPEIDLLAVVAEFVRVLDRRLTDHNDDHGAELQMRLRVAMNMGTVTSGHMGGGGDAFIVLSRLLDSAPVRAALASRRDANLALIISEEVYQKVVLSELGGLRAKQFLAVAVDLPAKGFHQTAYVHVPGIGPGAIVSGGTEPGSGTPEFDSKPKTVINTISGENIDLSRSILGFNEHG